MRTDSISKIWIDNTNRLCIKPKTERFKMIYRSAMGVNWNDEDNYLFSQIMRSRTPADWFSNIVGAVEVEYGYVLYINEKTEWENIDEYLKKLIEAENERRHKI